MDPKSLKFTTNVGLITSNGPHGYNIMACEWTHHVSYSPGIIVACIHGFDATADNIKKTKYFGVSLAADDQSSLSSLSGGNTGKEIDKISGLKKLGYKFYKAKKINVLMVKGASLNVECKLMSAKKVGDHIMFTGKVVNASKSKKESLVFHGGRYWKLTKRAKSSSKSKRARMNKVMDKFKK